MMLILHNCSCTINHITQFIDLCMCLMVVLFVFYIFEGHQWAELSGCSASNNCIFLMLILAFGQHFEFSNHPNTLIVDRVEWTGTVSAELASVTTISIENDQTSVDCRFWINTRLNIKQICATKMKQFLLNQIFWLEMI